MNLDARAIPVADWQADGPAINHRPRCPNGSCQYQCVDSFGGPMTPRTKALSQLEARIERWQRKSEAVAHKPQREKRRSYRFLLVRPTLRGRSLLGRDERRNVRHVPNPIRHASGHCRGHAKRLVNAAEVIVHVVERHGSAWFSSFFEKAVHAANTASLTTAPCCRGNRDNEVRAGRYFSR